MLLSSGLTALTSRTIHIHIHTQLTGMSRLQQDTITQYSHATRCTVRQHVFHLAQQTSVWRGSLRSARLRGSNAPPRPGSTPSRHRVPDIKIPQGGTERGKRIAERKFYRSKKNDERLHSMRAHFDQRPSLGCAPPTLPEKVRTGRYIIQWNLWRLHKILIQSIDPWGKKTAPQ